MAWVAGTEDGPDANSDKDSSEDKLMPPDFRKKPGRPPKRRIRGHSELKPVRKMRCGRCTELGHKCKEL